MGPGGGCLGCRARGTWRPRVGGAGSHAAFRLCLTQGLPGRHQPARWPTAHARLCAVPLLPACPPETFHGGPSACPQEHRHPGLRLCGRARGGHRPAHRRAQLPAGKAGCTGGCPALGAATQGCAALDHLRPCPEPAMPLGPQPPNPVRPEPPCRTSASRRCTSQTGAS